LVGLIKMDIKIYIVSSGEYGLRIINNIAKRGFAASIVGMHEFPDDLPEFIDDPQSYIPESIPECDLILSLGLKGDINLTLPIIASKACAKSVIAEIHDPAQLPPGLQREIEESAGDIKIVFAKPFCSLKPVGDEVVDEFASYFGKPELKIESDKLIKNVEVLCGAPCGSTWFVADALEGFPVEDAELESGNKIHNYPCIASMATDPVVGDTILHLAGYKIKEAVKAGVGFATKSAVVDKDACMGGIDCDHNCVDVCPNVKIGDDTVTVDEDKKAYINPVSCGCCEICVRECPYGAIEIVEEKIDIK
jgi:NAD-dependent dihydropyrimidine dehydrogenase PreA subunit